MRLKETVLTLNVSNPNTKEVWILVLDYLEPRDTPAAVGYFMLKVMGELKVHPNRRRPWIVALRPMRTRDLHTFYKVDPAHLGIYSGKAKLTAEDFADLYELMATSGVNHT